MNRKVPRLVLTALVLLTAFAVTVASASKPVTPKLGRYVSQVVGPPKDGNVKVKEIEVKVVKIGKRRGAQVRVSAFPPASCTSDPLPGGGGLSVLEKSPIPIKNGRFKRVRTANGRVAAGAGTATTRTVMSGTFKSPTKVLVRVFVKSAYSVQFPGQPEIKGACMGKQTGIAKRK